MKVFAIFALALVVLIGAEVFVYTYNLKKHAGTSSQPIVQKSAENKPQDADVVKKGLKRFRFESTDKAITGDGSMTLKENLTSVGVRLITAPSISTDMHYEVYAVLPDNTPVFMGELREVNSPSQKYLWAGAGPVELYKAVKIIVTKGKTAGNKPGEVLVEAQVMAEEKQRVSP